MSRIDQWIQKEFIPHILRITANMQEKVITLSVEWTRSGFPCRCTWSLNQYLLSNTGRYMCRIQVVEICVLVHNRDYKLTVVSTCKAWNTWTAIGELDRIHQRTLGSLFRWNSRRGKGCYLVCSQVECVGSDRSESFGLPESSHVG